MVRRWIWPWLLLFAVALSGPATALAPAQPPPPPPRIIAVGDLHGDHNAWIAIARGAGLIGPTGHWTGDGTVLVQVGDIVDRGPDSLKIIRDLMRLEREAPRSGGRVVVLVGNHEAMNMTGDLRYVHPGEYDAFVDRGSDRRRGEFYRSNRPEIEAAARRQAPKATSEEIRLAWIKQTRLGMVEHAAAWRPDGELGSWTIRHPAVVKVGGSLFVHGGISAAYATIPLDEINRRVAAALQARDEAPTSIINDSMGPLWYRGLVTRSDPDAPPPPPAGAPPRPTIEQEVDIVLAAYGVKRIVVGHTPSLQGIVAGFGGKLWRIDSANSSYYGGPPSYLEIIGDKVVAHKSVRPPAPPKGGKS